MSGITAIGICELVDQALEQFGKYSWDDKGPVEVMDVEDLCNQLKALGPEQADAVLAEASTIRKHDGRVQDLVNQLIECYLDDWDELYEQKWVSEQMEDLQEEAAELKEITVLHGSDFMKAILNK